MGLAEYTITPVNQLSQTEKIFRFNTTLNPGEDMTGKVTAALSAPNPAPGSPVADFQTFMNRNCPAGVQIKVYVTFSCQLV